jgi:hypothetical protein
LIFSLKKNPLSGFGGSSAVTWMRLDTRLRGFSGFAEEALALFVVLLRLPSGKHPSAHGV